MKNAQQFENAYVKLFETEIIPEIEKNGLSATVYTELTDLEDEQNGIFTFDRTLKINKQTLIDLNKKVENAYAKKFK